MPSNIGYSITTRRLRLCCGHPEWLRKTQDFYNEIESFYYDLLLAHEELGELGSQRTLRALEVLTIMGRDKQVPQNPLPWEKVPLYFRRAAINSAIAAANHYIYYHRIYGNTRLLLKTCFKLIIEDVHIAIIQKRKKYKK